MKTHLGWKEKRLSFWRLLGLALLTAIHCAVVQTSVAAEPTTIKLWEHGAPGTPATKSQDEPVLMMYTPTSNPTSTAVIILPGGGYAFLSMDHEGKQAAEWLNSIGVTAFVLKYRMKGTGHLHPVPMMDGQRAVRLVRSRAAAWDTDPARVGVLGFSAGGHLASTLGTHFDHGAPGNSDAIEHVSSRPDFLILAYPLITLTPGFLSYENLLGKSTDSTLLRNLSNETQVTKQTPPTFIFQTSEDDGVPAENCVAFYSALHKAGVPAEMHIFQTGPHGIGLAKDTPGAKLWPALCHEWLKNHDLLKPLSKSN